MPNEDDSIRFDLGFRADLLVERLVTVELKSVQDEHPGSQEAVAHLHQARRPAAGPAELRLKGGKDGITRVANRLPDAA